MEIAIMIEGQMGLNWPHWQRVVRAVEDLGFAGLYRSDHFTNPHPPDQDSLELWVSFVWLASHTTRIEFGPLVSPVSFRHPAMTVRMASAVDDLSGGRLILGLGAGWQDREHTNYSYDLLEAAPRFDRFDEALHVITGLLKSDEPVTFAGRYYRFNEAVLLPRPQRPGGPPILIGGNGPRRTRSAVVRYADEWNGVFIPPETFAELNEQLDEALTAGGRAPQEVRRSLMTGTAFASDDAKLETNLDRLRTLFGDVSADDLRAHGFIIGTPSEFVDRLGAYAEAGVQRIMLQWVDLDDMDGLEALAKTVL